MILGTISNYGTLMVSLILWNTCLLCSILHLTIVSLCLHFIFTSLMDILWLVCVLLWCFCNGLAANYYYYQIMAVYRVKNNVGVIFLNHPPVNSINAAVRQSVFQNVKSAEKDNKVQVIVIGGNGGSFSVGADITEFEGNVVRNFPNLVEVVEALESCSKPIVAAIHGYALGGGLELALGCHYRVATSSAKFEFPEVNLGILPGAGGTQRFPRLVGLRNAVDWICSGNHHSAEEAANIGLLDRVYPASSNIIECAIQFSKTLSKNNLASRRISLLPVKDAVHSEQIIARTKSKLADKARGAIAPYVCLQATTSSCTLPYSKGMKKENELMSMLMASGQSKALRHAFFAERSVGRWKAPNGINYKNSKPLKINKMAVIGLGTMGSGIAISLSTLGLPVCVLETNDKVLAKSVKWVYGIIDRMAKRGEITAEQCKRMQTNIIPCNSYNQIKDVDLVVEAVFESMKLKKEIFAKLDRVCKPLTILASNTSTFDIDVLAAQTRRPGKVVGMHFFAPAHRMRLLENVRGKHSSAQTLATVMDIGKKINHVTILVGNCQAFAANRMYALYMREGDYLIEEGAYPEQIDAVLRHFGFAMGRYEVADLSGNDVGYRLRREHQELEKAQKEGLRYCVLSDLICERGRYGVKTGKGWYNFVGGKLQVDPDVTELIDEHRKKQNLKPRKILPKEILERMLYPMVNEGFKLLEEGIASTPEDIDMIWIHGFAWPKHTGGLMYYAYTVGLPRILEAIENYWQLFGESVPYWEPSPMLVKLVKHYGNPHISQWMNLHHKVIQSSL